MVDMYILLALSKGNMKNMNLLRRRFGEAAPLPPRIFGIPVGHIAGQWCLLRKTEGLRLIPLGQCC